MFAFRAVSARLGGQGAASAETGTDESPPAHARAQRLDGDDLRSS
jgi:hypothetical protein